MSLFLALSANHLAIPRSGGLFADKVIREQMQVKIPKYDEITPTSKEPLVQFL